MPTDSVVFDRAADYYDATRGFPPGVETHAAELIARTGGLTSSSVVLEIGVGTGRIALPLAGLVAQVNGVDLSLPMLGRLRAKRTTERVHVVQGDIMRLPFAAASADAVLAVHIFHLVAGYAVALGEAARVLKPRGVLIHAWNENDNASALDAVWRSATGVGRGAAVGMSIDDRQSIVTANGWQPLDAPQRFDYVIQRAPNEYLDTLRQRMWSHTWSMSDEQVGAGVAAVEAYIRETYADPNAAEAVPAAFVAQAYHAPA
jgi:SAM-dependent methyltransferase